MISEIVADTHQSDQVTASGTDAFEYIELYNTSDRDIEMDDLLIRNVNGSTLTDWEIPSGTVIKAGQTLVVWVTNAESAQITEADFRAYYGIDDSVQIVKTVDSVNGFSNSGERSMQVIVRDSEQVISSITYNDGSEKAQTKKGIKFAYQDGQVQEVTLLMMKILRRARWKTHSAPQASIRSAKRAMTRFRSTQRPHSAKVLPM